MRFFDIISIPRENEEPIEGDKGIQKGDGKLMGEN